MKAILVSKPGGPEQLSIGEFPAPVPREDELLIRVQAAGVNRADILQRQGKYPPPPGVSPLLGLEIAGVVSMVAKTPGWKPGDRVMALLPGGGYAQLATVNYQMALPIPDNLSFEQAAGIPEAFLTAFQALFRVAALKAGESVLIHAGASGVGSAAIQLAKAFGIRAIATAGSDKKVQFCRSLGAELAVNYRKESFADAVLDFTAGKGVDAVIDFVGAPYWESNLKTLALDGRMVLLGLLGGYRAEALNLLPILRKRLAITGSTLRSRALNYKIRLCKEFKSKILPLFAEGTIKPIIDRVFHWQDVREAHRYMEANKNSGKLILKISD